MFQQIDTAPPPWSPRLSPQRWCAMHAMALFALVLAVGFLAGAPSPAQAATKTYPVVVNNHGLRVRERPTTDSRQVGSLFAGDRVRIICTTTGPNVKGPLGRSRIWDRIGTNRWVSDAFIRTGSNRPVAPSCNPEHRTPPPPPLPPQKIDYEFEQTRRWRLVTVTEIRFNMAATQLAATSQGKWCKYISKIAKGPLKVFKPFLKAEEMLCKFGYWMFRRDVKRFLSDNQCVKWRFYGPVGSPQPYSSDFCYRR